MADLSGKSFAETPWRKENYWIQIQSAHVRPRDVRETTVSLNDLAPLGEPLPTANGEEYSGAGVALQQPWQYPSAMEDSTSTSARW